MSDISASLAPLSEDDELRETLDLLATAVASISDQVDDQTRMLDRVNKTATEARSAAFAAQKQTDPEHYGDLVGKTLDGRINRTLTGLNNTASDLRNATSHTRDVLRSAEQDRSIVLHQIWTKEQKLNRLKSCLPWFGLGAVVLVLALTLMLPRFLASNGTTCAVLGASWTTTTTGENICVFFQK